MGFMEGHLWCRAQELGSIEGTLKGVSDYLQG